MKGHTMKQSIAKLLIAFIAVLSVAIITPAVADAASAPALSKTSRTILVGKQYDFNIKNKIAGSTYTWTTSNKAVARVNKVGVVTGVAKGTATITVKIKAPKKTYTLKAKVTIRKGAKEIQISNKVTALNVGQKYNLDRTLIPSTSNDKTTWTTSDASIASPDANGKFKALKEGTVTITATTISGAKDSVTIKVVDAEGTATNQSELDALVGSGASLVTLKTDAAAEFTIKAGDYSSQKLVVDAPNADVTNYGDFKSIEIKQIKSDTWTERGKNNTLIISDGDARIVIGAGSVASIKITAEGAKITLVNNGTVKELVLSKNTEIAISGTSDQLIPIIVDVAGVKITSSVPLALTANVKFDVTLTGNGEKSTITAKSEDAIPNITGNVTIDVTIGDKKVPVKGTPIVDSSLGGGGSSSGGGTTTSITFDTAINDISAISYTNSNGITTTINSTVLSVAKSLLTSDSAVVIWGTITNDSYTVGGQTISITGTSGTYSKVVSVSGGEFDGKSYTVAFSASSTGTAVTISANQKSVTLTKSPDDKSFTLSTSVTLQEAVDSPTTSDLLDVFETLTVTYKGTPYTIDIPELVTVQNYINLSGLKVLAWATLQTGDTKTIDGETINFTATADPATKIITFGAGGQFAGRSYTVTLTADSIVIKNAANVTATINKSTDSISVSLN